MVKNDKREVPLKNYFITLFVVLAVVTVSLYVKKTYEINEAKKLSQSVLSRLVGEVKYNEIDNVLTEKVTDYFLYLGYVNNKDVYNLETKMKKVISDYEIQDNFYYINVTEELNNDSFVNNLNNKLKLNISSVDSLPIILYYQAGKLKTTVTSKNGLFTVNDFKDVLISHGYQKK